MANNSKYCAHDHVHPHVDVLKNSIFFKTITIITIAIKFPDSRDFVAT